MLVDSRGRDECQRRAVNHNDGRKVNERRVNDERNRSLRRIEDVVLGGNEAKNSLTIDKMNTDGSTSHESESMTFFEVPRIILECLTLDMAGRTNEANLHKQKRSVLCFKTAALFSSRLGHVGIPTCTYEHNFSVAYEHLADATMAERTNERPPIPRALICPQHHATRNQAISGHMGRS